MKLFTPRKPQPPASAPPTPERAQATLDEISARLDKLERVVTDLKQNIDLIPAIVRRLYLDGMSLPAPYDLLSERFGYLSQNEEDGLLLAIELMSKKSRWSEVAREMEHYVRGAGFSVVENFRPGRSLPSSR